MDILNIENCTIRYQEQEAAVEHVSLSVGEQEIVSIVGESGSGKTTLIRAILGILPPGGTVTEGKILFQGKNILELDETSLQKLRGTEIAMIFQDVGASLDPIRIVESQYRESILAHRKMAKADCRSLEKEMLAKMHLTDPERVMVSYPFELSGGDVTMNDWGKRKLAYEINYEAEGNYVLWNFTSVTSFPAELERVLGITDGVLRFLVTVQ